MEEGLSDVAQRKIMLELKSSESPSDSGSTVAKVPLEGAVKLLENARLVAWDYTWNLGQKTPSHTDYHDSVIVFLEGGTIRSIAGAGGAKDTTRSAGKVA